MLNVIDSSELVAFLAKNRQNGSKSMTISMSQIFQLADFLEQKDVTIRVDLSRRSFEYLSHYAKKSLRYNDNEVRINDMQNPRIVQIIHQYYPDNQISKLLQKALNETR